MMWGDRPPRAKLTGDSRRGFEAVLIGDSRSVRSLATNWPLRLLRLLQQYGHKTEVPTGSEIVRFPRKTGSHQRTVRMTQLTHLGPRRSVVPACSRESERCIFGWLFGGDGYETARFHYVGGRNGIGVAAGSWCATAEAGLSNRISWN